MYYKKLETSRVAMQVHNDNAREAAAARLSRVAEKNRKKKQANKEAKA
jgi:hypothetical protein